MLRDQEISWMACIVWIHSGALEKLFSGKWPKHKRASRSLYEYVLKVGPQNCHVTSMHVPLAKTYLLTKPKGKGSRNALCPQCKEDYEFTWRRTCSRKGWRIEAQNSICHSHVASQGQVCSSFYFFSSSIVYVSSSPLHSSCTIKDGFTIHVTPGLQGRCYVSIL